MPSDPRFSRGGNQDTGGDPPIPDATKQVFGPMLAGFAIDVLDLMTVGPIGLYSGLLIGGAVGYVLAPTLGFPRHRWWISSLLTGIYCTLPLTAFVPAATFAVLVSRLASRGAAVRDAPSHDATMRPEGAIDVEYEVVEHEPEER